MSEPLRYPLDWPPQQPRHEGERLYGPYKVSQYKAQNELLRELGLLRARDIVISTNIPLRRDGTPFSHGRADNGDTGVAVYWTRKKQSIVIACDSYRDVRSNMRAIGLAIYHLRRFQQAAPALAEKAFSGFAQLPADAGIRPWRIVLELPYKAHPSVDAAKLKERFRGLARIRHPDRATGSHAGMNELNRAVKEAEEELGLS